MADVMEYLSRVTARAKEMYALSDQGEWDDLPTWMQAMWISHADEELRPTIAEGEAAE